MASDAKTGEIPGVNPVPGSQTEQSIKPKASGGSGVTQSSKTAGGSGVTQSSKTAAGSGVAQSGNPVAVVAAPPASTKTTVPRTDDPRELVANLNKFLNASGRPDQFRLDRASGGKLIQQVNPDTGEVVGEFSAVEFPELARSVGVTGLLIDTVA